MMAALCFLHQLRFPLELNDNSHQRRDHLYILSSLTYASRISSIQFCTVMMQRHDSTFVRPDQLAAAMLDTKALKSEGKSL